MTQPDFLTWLRAWAEERGVDYEDALDAARDIALTLIKQGFLGDYDGTTRRVLEGALAHRGPKVSDAEIKRLAKAMAAQAR